MSNLSIILTASLAQNVILVHFLGLWPFPLVLDSPRRALVISLGLTGALVWVTLFFWVVQRFVLVPIGAEVLETVVLTTIIGFSTLGAMRLGSQIAPFHRKRIMQTVPVTMVNTTVFVVSMGLVHTVPTAGQLLLGAVATGGGVLLALVPLSAVRSHVERSRVAPALRGDVSVYLATALMALGIQQIDRLLHQFFIPLY